MLIFLDTEFSGLDRAYPALISIVLAREDGESFYAELPPLAYDGLACGWVRENVLPLLWGGSYRLPPEMLRGKLAAWIEAIDGPATMVTDAPDFDFRFVRDLFRDADSFAMGSDRQAWLAATMAEYHAQGDRPEHHALHDAMSLRQGYLAARMAGWQPRT